MILLLLQRRGNVTLFLKNNNWEWIHTRQKHIDYCVNLVKSRDFDNYLSLNLLPKKTQLFGFAIRAFNIELAQIQEATSKYETGKMRIEFWRQNITKTFQGCPPNHPVPVSIALCLEQKMLSEKWFQRMIDIREKYINDVAFMSLDDAEDYGEYAISSMLYLLLESLNLDHLDSSYAASHLGVASSLVTMLRSTPYFTKSGYVILPTEVCVKHKISQEEILRNQNLKVLKEVVFDVASQASLHLDRMMKLLETVPQFARNIYLPYFPNQMFLNHLQRLDFDIFHSSLNKKHWTLPAVLYYKSLRTKW